MKARLRFALLGTAAALAGSICAAGSAAAAPAADRVRVSVVGIDRAGAPVGVTAYADTGQNPPVRLTTRPRTLDAGQYWIGAAITTPGTGTSESTETLVVRHVTISHSQTVYLDARPGKLVRISLRLPGAVNQGDAVQACFSGGVSGFWGASAPAGALYAVPLASRHLAFGYSSAWETGSATYYLAQQALGGIPRHPAYQVAPASLAKETLVLRSGTTSGGYQDWQLDRQFRDQCDIYELGLPAAGAPSRSTAYLSPGTWQFEVSGNGAWQDTRKLAAGHKYTDTFGAAVFGPGANYPTLDFGLLDYFPEEPFGDPLQSVGGECCDRSSISLSLHGRTLRRRTMTEYGANRSFSYRVHSAGWYTMRAVASRWVPGGHVPAGILSPRETTTWRFYVSPQYATLDSVVMPVSATRFVPQGLNLENQAPAGHTTRINVRVLPASEAGWTSYRYRIKSVSVQASFDGGRTWRSVRLVRRGGNWVAFVPAAAAGYVALRSTVADVRGDSTVQTIYRAYQIG